MPIDAVDLTEVYLDAMRTHEFAPRIYARSTEERARAEARAAADRARRGLRRSPLDGVPISWKDLFDSAGVATEAGSALLAGRVPERDAQVLATATLMGLVCLGKTHMTELAFSGLGLNPVTQSPPCVNDHDAVAGGSSSGAATSVAFGLAAAGIGSDTGGSVRIPAAWNDLVGLKTTHGLLSLEGVVPLAESFDTVGPLCRSVEDAALLLAAMQGAKAPDLAGATLDGTRLMVLETIALDQVREAPLAGFEAAVERLAAPGCPGRAAPPAVAARGAAAGRAALRRRGLWHLEGGDRGGAGEDVRPGARTLPRRRRHSRRWTMCRRGGSWPSIAGAGPRTPPASMRCCCRPRRSCRRTGSG